MLDLADADLSRAARMAVTTSPTSPAVHPISAIFARGAVAGAQAHIHGFAAVILDLSVEPTPAFCHPGFSAPSGRPRQQRA